MKKVIMVCFLLFAFLYVSIGCDDDKGKGSYTLTGRIVDVWNKPVDSAIVYFDWNRDSKEPGDTFPTYDSVITDANGQFTISKLDWGNWDITVIKPKFTTYKTTMGMTRNETWNFKLNGETEQVSGNVINSETGNAVANAQVHLVMVGDTSQSGTITTDSIGHYELLGALAGQYVRTISYGGYYSVSDTVVFPRGSAALGRTILVKNIPTGGFRVVLTWGKDVDNLDLYLTGPDTLGARFVCWTKKRNPNPYSIFELDDSTAYGPEQTYFVPHFDGTYRFTVLNTTAILAKRPSAEAAVNIFLNKATVKVYNETGLLKTYLAPDTINPTNDTLPWPTPNRRNWCVFEYVVTGGVGVFNDNGGKTIGWIPDTGRQFFIKPKN